MVESAPLHEILVVDDDYIFRWSLVRMCQRRNIDADIAENGREAMELLTRKRDRYCCLVLDLDLPAPTGPEILASLPLQGGPNVVVVTAYPDLMGDLSSLKTASLIRKTFTKPCDVADVIAEIQVSCRHAHAGVSRP